MCQWGEEPMSGQPNGPIYPQPPVTLQTGDFKKSFQIAAKRLEIDGNVIKAHLETHRLAAKSKALNE